MIIFKDLSWQSDSADPNANFLEGESCEQPKWVIPDGSELAGKITAARYWDPVLNEDGALIDIILTEPILSDQERISELKAQLAEIDGLAIRPLRAIASETATDEDREILFNLEKQAESIKTQLAELESSQGGGE